MTQSPGPSQIPNYIKAGSPIGLRRLMLLNNLRLGGFVQYFDIQQATDAGKTYWFAWYFEKSNDELFAEQVKKVKGENK